MMIRNTMVEEGMLLDFLLIQAHHMGKVSTKRLKYPFIFIHFINMEKSR